MFYLLFVLSIVQPVWFPLLLHDGLKVYGNKTPVDSQCVEHGFDRAGDGDSLVLLAAKTIGAAAGAKEEDRPPLLTIFTMKSNNHYFKLDSNNFLFYIWICEINYCRDGCFGKQAPCNPRSIIQLKNTVGPWQNNYGGIILNS